MNKKTLLILISLVLTTWVVFSTIVKFESKRMEERAINSAVELCTEICKVH